MTAMNGRKRRFNTNQENLVPMLPQTGGHVFILEDLELTFHREQLEAVTEEWNSGASIAYISKKHKRYPDEIFLALFHQARHGKVTRPFFEKGDGPLMKPAKEEGK